MRRIVAAEQEEYILAVSLVRKYLCFKQAKPYIPIRVPAREFLTRFLRFLLRCPEIASQEFSMNILINNRRWLGRGRMAAEESYSGQ